jgi:hypothetical protein
MSQSCEAQKQVLLERLADHLRMLELGGWSRRI